MRLRLRYDRLGKIRWTSARDVARMWERALRRAELPMAYSGGFSPRPKIAFGLALPTGHESTAEYVDLELDPGPAAALDPAALPARLSAVLPVGLDVTAVEVLAGRPPSLQHDVTSCTWQIEAVGAGPDRLSDLVGAALAADELVVTRVRKGSEVVDDLRPAILSLTVLPPGAAAIDRAAAPDVPSAVVAAELATQPRGVRPSELLAALEPSLEEGRVRRTAQWISRDGARWEPIPLPATAAPHAEARAS